MSAEELLRQHLIALAAELERLDDGSFPRSPSWVVLRARELAAAPTPAADTRDLLDDIDHDGSLQGSLPQFAPGVLTGSVRPRTGSTPYLRFGNWPVLLLAFAALAAGLWRPRPLRRAAGDGR